MKKLIMLFLLAATAAANATLVGWYKLDEGAIDPTTNVTWDAVSGSTNFGTLTPQSGTLTWVTNGLAPVPSPGTTAAIQFTPSTDGNYVMPYLLTTLMTSDQTGDGLAGGGPRTISAWIQPAATQIDANPTIVSMGSATPNGARCTFRMIAGSGGYVLRCEFQGGGKSGTKNLCDGKWHFVAVVQTNNTVGSVILYVDGVPEAISASSGLTTVINVYTNYAMTIGGTEGSGLGDRGYTGLIDDVRIYNQALAPSDIIKLYLGPGIAPSLTQVANQSLVLGSTNSSVTFNAGAVGTPPLNIQWKFKGVNIPGATNDALALSPANVTNAGTYTVTVTNAYGGTSGSAQLTLNTSPINPPRQAVLVGQSATFAVTMPADSTGYTYQWLTNGVNISGATSSTLTINNASATNASTNYQVVVTLGANSATSSPAATLNVLPVPSSLYSQLVLGDDPAGYWRLDEANGVTDAASQTRFYPGTYVGNAGSELQQTGALTNDTDTAFQLTGNNYMQIPYNAQLTSSNGLTLEVWVNPSSIGSAQDLINCSGGTPTYGYLLFISAAGNPVFTVYNSASSTAVGSTSLTASTALVAGSWSHIVATYDGTNQNIYVNGSLAGTQAATYIPVTPGSAMPVRFGAGGSAFNSSGAIVNPFNGVMDEPAIYSEVLSAQQVANHYEAGFLGAGVAPTITTQPTNQRVILGDTNATATFSVTAFGSPLFNYQWKLGGNNLTGGTNSTLVLAPVTSAALGTYSVGVTNAGGGVLSSNATLSYMTGPISPNAQAVFIGSPATFTLTGMPAYQTYTYQWKHAGTNLPGATTATLSIPAASAADAGTYTIVATLGSHSAESDPATLAVLAAPSQSYTDIVAADSPVAWWRLDDAPGATTAAEVSGTYPGSVYSDVTMGVEGALLGDSDTCASFTGYGLGSRAGNSKILVGLDPALNPTVFSVECWALVTGGAGTYRSPVTSRSTGTGAVNGYVLYAADDDTWQFWLGNGNAFMALAGPAVVPNQWAHLVGTYDGANAAFYVNGVLVSSTALAYVANSSYPLYIGAGATETANGSYFFPGRLDEVAVYTNALSLAQVQAHYAGAFPIGAAPRFTAQPLSRATLAGENYTLSASVHSTPTVSYQWQLNGTNLPAATNATLALNSVSSAQAGSYQLVATHGSARSTNAPASLQVNTGEAVSVNLEGFENVQTISANGGYAGYVRVTNWNEIAYSSDAGSVTNLVNNKGQTNAMVVAWTANNNRHWNGPVQQSVAGDVALLDGFLEAVSGANITLTLSGIPTNYQAAGYSLYVYMGEPNGTAGIVNASDTFGQVGVGAVTNYYHALDLATWDGNFYPAVTTDPFDSAPTNANYALFTNLNSASVTVTVAAHPNLTGPASLSGFQLMANVVTLPMPVSLAIAQSNSTITLSWPGTWVLQRKSLLDNNPNTWADVTNASPYAVPTPLSGQQYYRLRSP